MRAVIYQNNEAHYLSDQAKPVPLDGESLIRVELAAICNTDREILHAYRPDFHGIIGHEFVGVVEQSANDKLQGKRVVGEINISCGNCLYCLTDRPNHCVNRATLGIHNKNGTFADYVTLPDQLLWVVGDDLRPDQAIFTEPLAAALRITEQIDLIAETPVAVVGDGRLALLIVEALALTTNAQLTVIGKHPEKLQLFERFAQTTTSTQDSYEVVIEASGNPAALSTAIGLTRSLGTLVMKSTYAGTTEIDMSEIVVREIKIVGSRCGPFDKALDLLHSHRLDLPSPVLFKPQEFQAAFDSSAFKVALDFR
ncbi:MAG: alcohol dehydrogenase catalytic domain-containing protein [Coriobacteriia bacterium]|nr:alcohol dehydrogenase catalytic domain-containing protein [Coriobacteriia bacterium]